MINISRKRKPDLFQANLFDFLKNKAFLLKIFQKKSPEGPFFLSTKMLEYFDQMITYHFGTSSFNVVTLHKMY